MTTGQRRERRGRGRDQDRTRRRGSADGSAGGSGPTGSDENTDRSQTDDESTTATRHTTTYTPRFAGFIVLFGLFVAAGLVTFHPAALAGAGLLLAFLLAGLVQTPTPPGERLRASYAVDPAKPRPGERVTVEVTVSNEGEDTLTDLRLVDAVPDDLRIVGGTPRAGAVLRPGDETTIEYEVLARRGEYEFGPLVARTRTMMGSMWTQQAIEPGGERDLSCAVRADDLPLEERAAHFIGQLLSQTGGDGVEFYATREYHRGDPPSRINWRELAKHGDLSTITYRERQAANVTLVADARPQARLGAGPGEPSGALLGGYATYQLVHALVDDGHFVGVTVPGLRARPERRSHSQFPCRRIDHGRGDEQRRLAFDLLDELDRLEAPAGGLSSGGSTRFRRGDDPSDRFDDVLGTTVGGFERQVTGWASPNTQFVCVTPLLDGAIQGLCRRLRNRDFPVVVISPDVTAPMAGDVGEQTPPQRLLGVQRAIRIEALRQDGCTVIDWDPAKPLSVCCERQTVPGA